MAINPFLLLSGIGMMAVAVIAIVYWSKKTGVKMKFFLAGSGVWLIAIAVKMLLDMAVTMPFQQWLISSVGIGGTILVISIYVGLRTGFIESGLSYAIALKTWLKNMTFKEAVAFGIGFGALEAFVIGFSSFLNILIFVLMPEIVATVPIEYQALLIEQLSLSTLFVIPAIVERAAAIMIHIFSSVLVIYAIRSRNMKFLWYSIIYKTVVDGIIPAFVFLLNPATSLLGAYLIEIPFIIIGVAGFYGTKWLKKKKWQD